jgi:hypothetical protein
MRRVVEFLLVVLGLAACAGQAAPPAAGTGVAWGFVRLVPREGVTPPRAGGSPYSDPRLRDVRFVDYEEPGFAVVYLEGLPAPGGASRLAIRDGRFHPHLEPALDAVGAGGEIRVANASAQPHVVSCPSAGLLRRLAPGEELVIPVAGAGEHRIFVVDVADAEARVFASPGPYAIASEQGRWELRDVAPGRFVLGAWHPRFPPVTREVEVASGQVVRVDLGLQVGGPEEARDEE